MSTAWLTFGSLCLQARLSVGVRVDVKDITLLMQDTSVGSDTSLVDFNESHAEGECPPFMVKRCRYCPYEKSKYVDGCQNCFRLDTETGQGTLCAKARMSSKCTGEGFWHKPPKCNLAAGIDKDRISELFEGAKDDVRIDTTHLKIVEGPQKCPQRLVKRCRFCPYDEGNGCSKCFRLDTKQNQTSGKWQGSLCTGAISSSRCTGEGKLHSPPKCHLNSETHCPLVNRLTTLANANPEDAVLEMWDSIYMRHNLCNELEVEIGDGFNPTEIQSVPTAIINKFNVLSHSTGKYHAKHMARFAQLRHMDKMHNGKTMQQQLHESLFCKGRVDADLLAGGDDTVDVTGGSTCIPIEKQEPGHKETPSLFDTVLKPLKGTGKSMSRGMKTSDQFFRLKQVDADEKKFWEKNIYKNEALGAPLKGRRVGSIFLDHWLRYPKSTMARFYAIVNVRSPSDGSPMFFGVMQDAFAETPDIEGDQAAKIYDVKGSDRECKGLQKDGSKKKELCGKKGEEAKEQLLDHDYPDGLALPAWGANSAYQEFFQNVFDDINLLKLLKIHDYSLVMRLTPSVGALSTKPDETTTCPALEDAVQTWEDAPKWRGPANEICALKPDSANSGKDERSPKVPRGSPVRISAVLLDFLQDSTTIHNTGASLGPGSKTWSSKYAPRLAQYLVHTFRPFSITENTTSMDHGLFYGQGLVLKPPPDPEWLQVGA